MKQLKGQSEEIIRDLPKSLLNWYDFKKDSKILYIGEEDAYSEVLEDCVSQIIYADSGRIKEGSWQRQHEKYFNYVVCVEKLEKEENLVDLLIIIRKLLTQEGIFLLGMNNRLGIQYFCGDRDPYTRRSFDGIEDYKRAYVKKQDDFYGRMYSKEELRKMLINAGWRAKDFQFFSVLSDLRNPSLIYAEDYFPRENLGTRLAPTYNYPDTVFLEEEALYQGLSENGMFHQMANSYLIECSMNRQLSDISHVTSSMDRGRDGALLTLIHKSGIVEKKAVYPEGKKRLELLIIHGEELKKRGLSVVDGKIVNNVYQMPYVDAEIGQMYLKRLLQTNQKKFLKEMDHFRDLILQSSEIVAQDKGDGKGAILQKCYVEMLPLNSFYVDGEFVFFDQEFCMCNYPANMLLFRMIATLYSGDVGLQKILSADLLYERYGLTKYLGYWRELEWKYLQELLNKKELRIYHEKNRRNSEVVNMNRQRMNYSEMEYQRLFVDIFNGLNKRKLILFGSGAFAKRFIGMYGRDYQVYAVIDNNRDRWGKEIDGIGIQSPEILDEICKEDYKIIICIKNFLSVTRQLDSMGIKNYSIFDPGKAYPHRESCTIHYTEKEECAKKRYRTGYVAGVFDMFHVGHVKLLRRAKEQCDYLIVGVVSDEDVYRQKFKHPVIPCEDRIEILRSCRYVDQVRALPQNYTGIRDAYKLFQFDCMFSGNDHEDNIYWKADKEFLEKNGSDIVFFDYTEKVSSTKLRKQLEINKLSRMETY